MLVRLVVLLATLVAWPAVVGAVEDSECPFAGKRPSDEVLRSSKETRPPLCLADLSEYSGPIPEDVDLAGADLRGANLANAKLVRMNLEGANLQDSGLIGADLTRAYLQKADLRRARLYKTKLNNAELDGADLSGAYLFETELSGTTLDGTNLHSAVFEPAISSLTSVHEIARASNLMFLDFLSPHAVVALRKKFGEAGFRAQEREVIFAKLRREQISGWHGDSVWARVEAGFSFLAFDLTSAYGVYYGRPLKILAGIIVMMTVVYAIALGGRGRAAIWRVWAPDRIRQDEGLPGTIRLSWERVAWPAEAQRSITCRVCRAGGLGLLFSLLSSFQIGWKELNVGNWLSRVQPREYTLRATGWVRVVAGIQSLVSVYLLALWALTYFGRPFE